MSEENSGLPGVPPPPPQPTASRPADYYEQGSAQPTTNNSGCRKWAIGCGGAGCLAIILLFAGFTWLGTRGMPILVGYAFEQIETSALDAGSVSPEMRKEFHDELGTLRTNIRHRKVSREELQGLLQTAMSVMEDSKVDRGELDDLLAQMKRINASAREHSGG